MPTATLGASSSSRPVLRTRTARAGSTDRPRRQFLPPSSGAIHHSTCPTSDSCCLNSVCRVSSASAKTTAEHKFCSMLAQQMCGVSAEHTKAHQYINTEDPVTDQHHCFLLFHHFRQGGLHSKTRFECFARLRRSELRICVC